VSRIHAVAAHWLTHVAIALSVYEPWQIGQTPCYERSYRSGTCFCGHPGHKRTSRFVAIRREATRWFDVTSTADRQLSGLLWICNFASISTDSSISCIHNTCIRELHGDELVPPVPSDCVVPVSIPTGLASSAPQAVSPSPLFLSAFPSPSPLYKISLTQPTNHQYQKNVHLTFVFYITSNSASLQCTVLYYNPVHD